MKNINNMIKNFDSFISEGKYLYANDRYGAGKQFDLFQQTHDLFVGYKKLLEDCETFLVNYILSHGSKIILKEPLVIRSYKVTDRDHKFTDEILVYYVKEFEVDKWKGKDTIFYTCDEKKRKFNLNLKHMDLVWVLELIEYFENITKDNHINDKIEKVEL